MQEITPLGAEDDKHDFATLLFSVILFSSSREISWSANEEKQVQSISYTHPRVQKNCKF